MLSSKGPDTVKMGTRSCCAVCGEGSLELAIELPNLPHIGMYSTEPMTAFVGGIGQEFLLCPSCGHGQLSRIVDPDFLYGESFSFRSSLSATAKEGTGFFVSVLEQAAPGRRFRCALDLGCNDLYLLKQLQGRAERRVGIDPIWVSREDQNEDEGIRVVGSTVEQVDLEATLDTPPDLLLCRNTLEHIDDPRAVLERMLSVAAEDAVFLFDVPGFEALVNRLRFDQVTHQHIQYFSLASFRRLLEEVGAVCTGHWENYHDSGALLVAFTKGRKAATSHTEQPGRRFQVSDIQMRYALFRRQLAATNEELRLLTDNKIYGYGAEQNLPVLAYHLDNNLACLEAVLDDDPNKDGLYYRNLPLAIRLPDSAGDLESASVLITAVERADLILRKLLRKRPRHIVYPFHII